MRGDNTTSDYKFMLANGSPPHARGQPAGCEYCSSPGRFTPACAGTTNEMWIYFSSATVHPRMRGDNLMLSASASGSCGSPPHARGQHARKTRLDSGERFTPACAGTTIIRERGCWFFPVHPRMRGDNWTVLSFPSTTCGSPPHARGQRGRPSHQS